MTWTLIAPALAAAATGLGAGAVTRRLRPALSVPLLTVLAVASALAVAGALALVSVGFLAQAPGLVDLRWCRSFARTHDAVPAWLGVSSSAALPVMVAAVVRAARRRRRAVAELSGGAPVQLLATPDAVAYAVPGRPGHIVVSEGMLALLEGPEQEVLIAHERSHLERRHDRYLSVAHLAATAVPVLRLLVRELRFATERWADEDAAAAVGDRRLVARTIARAALASSGGATPGTLALGGHGSVARVEALLAEPPGWPAIEATVTVAVAAALVTVTGSTVQAHHLLAFASHVCRI